MMLYQKFLITLFLLPICIINNSDSREYELPAVAPNSIFIVDRVYNLNREIFELPEGVTLKFCDGGRLQNGTIVGKGTRLKGSSYKVFKDVMIEGTWIVQNISSDLFIDKDRPNTLKELFNLASPEVKNVITITEGEYQVSIDSNNPDALIIPSNTEVIINGYISLLPNELPYYSIVLLSGNNIWLHGKGLIIGDKENHLGTSGEWGMGINIKGGNNIKISETTVKNCWGDCIYIGGGSTNIHIKCCLLDGGRRQGISITSAGKVYVEDCTIKNVKGTLPEYAIDVEPNENQSVEYVQIKDVEAIDCRGGFMSWHPAKNSSIGTVEIVNCSVSGNVGYYDYRFERADKVIMKNNKGVKGKITLSAVNEAVLINNSIKGQIFSDYRLINCEKVIRK